MDVPRTNFLEHEGVNIAWQVFGEGPAEILFIPGWVSNVDMFWQFREPRNWGCRKPFELRSAGVMNPGL